METSNAIRVGIVGSANMDYIMKSDRLPKVGETVTNARFSQAFGGKGANQAVAVARAWPGADPKTPASDRIAFVASIGNDAAGSSMEHSWSSSGLDTSLVIREGQVSGCALIMIGEGGRNYIAAAPEANDLLTPEHVQRVWSQLATASHVLLQFEMPVETAEHVLKLARENGVATVWNVAPMREVRPDLVGLASVVVVNETEAELLTGRPVNDASQAEAAGEDIRRLGTETAIVTLGENGSMIVDSERTVHVPPFPVKAVDSTAAGDTYCGCLVAALAEGKSMDQAVTFASAGAAISVGRLGAQPSVPWRTEIEEFLRSRGS